MRFYFITVSYEIGAPAVDEDTIKAFQGVFERVLDLCFAENGKYGVSFHARDHHFNKDARQRALNFHIILPRFLEDKKQIEEYFWIFDRLDEDVKVWNSLFFLKNHLMFSNNEVTARFQQCWDEYFEDIPEICKAEIFKWKPIIHTTGRYHQDLEDFENTEDYLNNEAMRVFKGVQDIVKVEDAGKMMFVVKRKGGEKPLRLDKLLIRYLIEPNRSLISKLRWSGYGALCGNSRFSKVMEYATFLRFDNDRSLNELSPSDIVAAAKEYQELYPDDREIGWRLRHHILRLKEEKPELTGAKCKSELEALAKNDRTVYRHDLLFTFFKIHEDDESTIKDILQFNLHNANVEFLGTVGGFERDRLLYRVEKDSFYTRDEFQPFLEKYSQRFARAIRDASKEKLSKEEFRDLVTPDDPHRVRVEVFPRHIYTINCVYIELTSRTYNKYEEKYRSINGRIEAIKKVLDVERVEIVRVDGQTHFIAVKSTGLSPNEMRKEAMEYAIKLEQYYRWDFITKFYTHPFVDITLTESKAWSFADHW